MKKMKTNAMRILDRQKIPYQVHEYAHHEQEAVDGMHVARLLQEDPARVFKTLVTQGRSHQIYVFVIPVNQELDLKQAALCVKEKAVEMIPVKQIFPLTGYIRGGCSPIGMKKNYSTHFHASALNYDSIFFSGGQIGLQIEMDPRDLMKVIPVQFDLIEGAVIEKKQEQD